MSATVLPATILPEYSEDNTNDTIKTVVINGKHADLTLNNIVKEFSIGYNPNSNTDTKDKNTADYNTADYNTDLSYLKKWVEKFVSESRTLSDNLLTNKPIQLRMKKRGTTIGPPEYSELKSTLEKYKKDNNDNKGTPEYILKLLENDVFYMLHGNIGQHKGNGDFDYDISINTISEPFDKCVDVSKPHHIITIDQSYNILNGNTEILKNILENKKPKIDYSNKSFQLCIKINNNVTDNTKSTLVNMSIL